ncbi:hypothetical protein ROBYS_45390 [Roseobacter sp. OBYS 0001]|nr:hypothetical protein ROBYS_45390 [Roseobacter sp. OBYS 0001]
MKRSCRADPRDRKGLQNSDGAGEPGVVDRLWHPDPKYDASKSGTDIVSIAFQDGAGPAWVGTSSAK